MNIDSLKAIGLTAQQAAAYAYLIEYGEAKPSGAAKSLKLTRTNAYKVFDKLVELKLAARIEQGKTFVYTSTNPLSLVSLTAQYRAEAVAREEVASSLMQDLLAKYYEHSDKPNVETFTGNKEVAGAYRKQLALREEIHFIHTKADVPAMSFDVMHDIRMRPAAHNLKRYGILTAPDKGPVNKKSHERGNLEVTWAKSGSYTAPVEWSVTEHSLLIVTYTNQPQAVLIIDQVVASAFLQLWKMLSIFLGREKTHKRLQAL